MPRVPGYSRMTKTQRFSAAGISAVGAAALALTVVPGVADAGESDRATAKTETASARPVAFDSGSHTVKSQRESIDTQLETAKKRAEDEAEKKAAAKKKAEKKRQAAAAAKERKQAAEKKASRAAERAKIKSYPDNLDGWIREALAIMDEKGIPGSYEGIKRNIMRESGGDPNVSNNWDINAQNGTPSKGLLQVIQPTFDKFHVEGTANDLTDPVANIVAACNYAAATYGSMDNVDSAY